VAVTAGYGGGAYLEIGGKLAADLF